MQSSPGNAVFILEIVSPGGTRRLPLGEQPVSIGRHADNKIALDDDLASRFHCIIGTKSGRAWVKDLNSSNGTFVNGKKVNAADLLAQDVVSIGSTRIRVMGTAVPTPPQNAGTLPAPKRRYLGNKPTLNDLKPLKPMGLDAPAGTENPVDTDSDLPSLDALASLAAQSEVPELEELDAADLEDSQDLPGNTPWARAGQGADDDGHPIALDEGDLQVTSYNVDAERVLGELAAALPDRSFGFSDISLLNSRGQVVHAPGQDSNGSEAVSLCRQLMLVATRSRATDIHIEPRDGGFQARMRIDGTMLDVVRIPTQMGVRVLALVKVLSDIDLSQRNDIQEGHFTSLVPSDVLGASSRRIDYRISFAPSVFGQKLVMRVLDTNYAPLHVRALNLPDWMREDVEAAIKQDSGMLLVCGPTGSGKTTTLYALVRGSNVQRRNVVTIEDPVEIQLGSVTQIPVDEEQGKGFASLLRSVLRQDPDVIMIGEIRDGETARIAMQAAVTGHLVFSTIHTRDTPGTIFRLLDLGIEPYLVAQALHLVLAQRLVRQLCPKCKKPVVPSASQISAMGAAGRGVKRLYRPSGCPSCLGTGFWGRRAFFELLTANDALRDVIVSSPTLQRIQEALSTTRFQPLQQSAYQLVADGVVAFSEIERALGRALDGSAHPS